MKTPSSLSVWYTIKPVAGLPIAFLWVSVILGNKNPLAVDTTSSTALASGPAAPIETAFAESSTTNVVPSTVKSPPVNANVLLAWVSVLAAVNVPLLLKMFVLTDAPTVMSTVLLPVPLMVTDESEDEKFNVSVF